MLMKKTVLLCLVLWVGFFLFTGQAIADKCKDTVVDEVSAFSEADRTTIDKAINKLVLRGADVRVQVLSSFHNTSSIDEYKMMFQGNCKYWQSPDGGMKNNLILLLVVPKKQVTGIYIGEQWRRYLENDKASIKRDMDGRFRDGKLAEGILVGLKNIDVLLSVDLASAKKPIVINNNTPADMSGLWSFFKWLLFIVALVIGGWFALRVHSRRTESRAAQREAMTERAKCVQAINGYTTPLALLKSKITTSEIEPNWSSRLNHSFTDVETAFTMASAAFKALDRSANNPETPRLSAQEYKDMALRYLDVFRKFESAQGKMSKIVADFKSALSGKPLSVSEEPRTEVHDRHFPAGLSPEPSSLKDGKASNPRRQSLGGYGTGQTPHHQESQPVPVERGGDTTIIVMNEERRDFDRRDWSEQRSRHSRPGNR